MAVRPGAPAQAGLSWPLDDTEESVTGTDRHQQTILNLRLGINEIARATADSDAPLPWQALSQTMLMGFSHPDGSPCTTLPDVFVYSRPMPRDRSSLSVALEGPPCLIVEVASDSTYSSDLDLRHGKAWSYQHEGVAEYLVVDTTKLYIVEGGRGWRLREGHYEPWLPDTEGVWWSEEIPLGFGTAEMMISVFDRQGRGVPREGEILPILLSKDTEIADLRRQLEERNR
jgi:Uma2 family endonuclease